jgi:hypothetical protein
VQLYGATGNNGEAARSGGMRPARVAVAWTAGVPERLQSTGSTDDSTHVQWPGRLCQVAGGESHHERPSRAGSKLLDAPIQLQPVHARHAVAQEYRLVSLTFDQRESGVAAVSGWKSLRVRAPAASPQVTAASWGP